MYKVYQVMNGDTIGSIAEMFNTTVEMIQSLNGINTVMIGSYIVVPNNSQAMFNMYTVQKGDSLYQIANKFGVSLSDLISINGLDKDDYIYPNQELLIPNNSRDIYVTKENDTLMDLMESFNADIDDIMNQNDKILLMPDQLIVYKKWENS